MKEITASRDIAADDGLNEYYIALYRYDSAETGDLNFNQGEVILVTKKDGDWWTGCIGSKTGIFPSNYVEKCDAPSQVYKIDESLCLFLQLKSLISNRLLIRQGRSHFLLMFH